MTTGEAGAILAGDALLTLAFKIISKDSDSKTACRQIVELSESIGTRGMVGGQMIDLEFKGKKKNKNILTKINRLKTSKLFEASAKLGSIAAGAGEDAINALGRFGALLGMAFQIRDDIIDNGDYVGLFGTEKSRRDLHVLIEKAKRALKFFGKNSNHLMEIADGISYRKNR